MARREWRGDVRWALLGLGVAVVALNCVVLFLYTADGQAMPAEATSDECCAAAVQHETRVRELDQAFVELAHEYVHLQADVDEMVEHKCIIRRGAEGHLAHKSGHHHHEGHDHHHDDEDASDEAHALITRFHHFSLRGFLPADVALVAGVLGEHEEVWVGEGLREYQEAVETAAEAAPEQAGGDFLRATLADALLKGQIEWGQAAKPSAWLLGAASCLPLPQEAVVEGGLEVVVVRQPVASVVLAAKAILEGVETSASWGPRGEEVREEARQMVEGTGGRRLACRLAEAWKAFDDARVRHERPTSVAVAVEEVEALPATIGVGLAKALGVKAEHGSKQLHGMAQRAEVHVGRQAEGLAGGWDAYAQGVVGECLREAGVL